MSWVITRANASAPHTSSCISAALPLCTSLRGEHPNPMHEPNESTRLQPYSAVLRLEPDNTCVWSLGRAAVRQAMGAPCILVRARHSSHTWPDVTSPGSTRTSTIHCTPNCGERELITLPQSPRAPSQMPNHPICDIPDVIDDEPMSYRGPRPTVMFTKFPVKDEPRT